MSNAELWEKIVKQKEVASVVSREIGEELTQLTKTLHEGVSLPVALRVINTIWGTTPTAAKVKVQLSDTFHKENGQAILWGALPETELKKLTGDMEQVVDYFDTIHAYIEKYVAVVLARLMQGETFTEAGQEALNEFRKNVLKYASYVRDFFYEVKEPLEKEETQHWNQISVVPTCIENGDYLFFDTFQDILKENHEVFLKRTFCRDDRSAWCLDDFNWSADRLEAHLKLPLLFAAWLNANYSDAVAAETSAE
jgi:hypothetical protein